MGTKKRECVRCKKPAVTALYCARCIMDDEIHRLRQMETETSVLIAESDNTRVDGRFAEYMLDCMRGMLCGGPYEREGG